MCQVSQMLRTQALKIVPGNMKFRFVCRFHLFVNHVCVVRKTPEWPLCVFIALNIIYSGVCVILQPSYYMFDMMPCCLLDTVPMFWRNLLTTQHAVTFQQTVIKASVCSNIWNHQTKRSNFLCKTNLSLFLVSSLYVQ